MAVPKRKKTRVLRVHMCEQKGQRRDKKGSAAFEPLLCVCVWRAPLTS